MSRDARFKKLMPFGLLWAFITGVVVHIIGVGGSGAGYWLVFAGVWTIAGLCWAYLLARFTKPKSNSKSSDEKDAS